MQHTQLDQLKEQDVSHNPAVRKKVMVDGTTIPHLNQFAEASFPPGETAPAHAHADLYEVFLVESGSGTMTVDGREIAMTVGSCITVEPGETHAISNTGEDVLRLRYFSVRR